MLRWQCPSITRARRTCGAASWAPPTSASAEPESGLAVSIVAGVDVGATHTRALIVQGSRRIAREPFPTADCSTALGLLQAALGEATPQAVCVAVAGPVVDGAARLTNGHLAFDGAALQNDLAVPALTLVNDLEALATEAPHLGAARLMPLGGAPASGSRAVLAPGTGLGMAFIDADGRVWPSEGGHAPLAPADALERELLGTLSDELGYVSWEGALSGSGLVNLYRAMCHVWGNAPAALTPSQVTARAVTMEDPVCHQTLDTWCGLLGNAAGALAVTACAHGGIYLGGGIAPRIADFIAASSFRRRFEERGAMSDYARDIATTIIMDEMAGAAGAARWAGRLLAGSAP